MDWLRCINKTLNLIEDNIQTNEGYALEQHDIAKEVGVSSMYLQKAFPLMTGYTIA